MVLGPSSSVGAGDETVQGVQGLGAANGRNALPQSQGCDGQPAVEKNTHVTFALLVLTQLYLAEKHEPSHSHMLPSPRPALGSRKPGHKGRAFPPADLQIHPAAFCKDQTKS